MTNENEEGVILKPTVFLKQDFIGVWDKVFPDDFCDFIKNYVDTSSYVKGRETPYVQDKQICISAFSPGEAEYCICLLYTSPSPRDRTRSRMPSSA